MRLIVMAAAAAASVLCTSFVQAQGRVRARDLGVPFDGTPGPLNAITDVQGVEVGHATLISGSGRLVVGRGPVRTGVTAVLPRGKARVADPVFAAWFSLNGNGEMTGTTWIEESGYLEGPVMITNTHSVGVVRDAVIQWLLESGVDFAWGLPVVAETYDGLLNDINGFHVKPEHAFQALDQARAGPVDEGAVGGGTGMICNGYKGGIGTSSRRLTQPQGGYTVGVLVQCNYGSPALLRIAGVPVGREIPPGNCYEGDTAPSQPFTRNLQRCSSTPTREPELPDIGSIIIVVATDAPLLPHQLKRLARRAALGLGREGSIASNGSGDIFIAFSTANPGAYSGNAPTIAATALKNDRMDAVMHATVQATEEAITNAMVAARTMVGADNVRINALPHDRLREVLRKYNRLSN